MKKFRHLNVPSHWEHYWSKYPEGYTILEALLNWVEDVDKLTDNVNDWNERLDEFVRTFDENLQETVTNVLTEWKEDGTLDHIINDTIFSWKADKVDVGDIKDLTTDVNENLVLAVNGVDDDVKDISYVAPIHSSTNIAKTINEYYQSLPEGAWLRIPQGQHDITEGLVFDRGINIEATGAFLNYTGDSAVPAVTIGKDSDWTRRFTVNGLVITKSGENKYGNSEEIGLRVLNVSYADIEFSIWNFTNGAVIDSNNRLGNVYNDFRINHMYNNLHGIVIRTDNGWSNENNYYGGGFSSTSDTASDDHIHIVIEHNGYRNNNHRFYGPSFESAVNGIKAIKSDGASIYFYAPRFEGATKVIMGDNSTNNHIYGGYGVGAINVEGKVDGLSIYGDSHIDIALDNRAIHIRRSSNGGNIFKSTLRGTRQYQVDGEGNVYARNLDIFSEISSRRGFNLLFNEPEDSELFKDGSLLITDQVFTPLKTKTWGAPGTSDGVYAFQVVHAGLTSERPTNVPRGYMTFDRSLNKPVWWDGENWVDATGAEV